MRTIWRRQRVAVPLCEKHWLYAQLVKVIRIVYLAASWVPLAILFVENALKPHLSTTDYLLVLHWSAHGTLVWWFITFLVLPLVWFLLRSRVKVQKITETIIELKGVASQFASTLEQAGETNREKFASEIGVPFGSPTAGEDRILPSGDDNYLVKT